MKSALPCLRLALAGLCIVLLACSAEKHETVVEEYTADYAALRSELAELAMLIPDTITPTETPPDLDPLPRYKKGDLRSNTAVVMYEQLADPDINLQNGQRLDFYGSNNLIRNLQWTGPRDPRTDDLKSQKATSRLAREMEYPLDVRYLAVARTFQHERARATAKDQFKAGAVAMGLFLIDRQSKSLVAQGGIIAHSSDQVEYRFSEEGDPVAALEAWANNTVWENARQAAFKKLEEISGGSFQ